MNYNYRNYKKRNKKKFNFSSFLSTVFTVSIAVILAGIAVFNLYLYTLPPISQLENFQPTLVSQIVAKDGQIIKTFGSFQFKKINENEVPDILKKAFIATEDKNFYKHQGFDTFGILRSTFENMKAGHVVQGASTITQQLARILFLSTEKTFDRKLKELVIANRLEKTLSKDEILEMYLNNVYLGEGAYGVSAAANVYFGKKPKNLTLAEAALIAGLPQAPSVYSPYQNKKLAKERRAQVLNRMYTMDYITKEEFETTKKLPIKLKGSYRVYSTNKAPYFTDYVMKELLAKAGLTEQEISQGGYKIYTTIDYEAQREAQRAIETNMRAWGLNKDSQQAALFSFDAASGKILAYVGGKDYGVSQFDRVSQAVRQPGSSFKMFVYASALEHGLTPDDKYEDKPITIADWTPRNYNNRYRGQIPLHKALAVSSNAVAVRLIMDVGVNEVANLARRLGITTAIAGDPTIALGSSAVKLFELTNAYGVLANNGIKITPYAVEKVVTSRGEVVYSATQDYSRVLDVNTVASLVGMMKEVVTKGTGRAADFGRPAAGKTGTTDSCRDAWFIGFTPEVVAGVWVGNDNNESIGKVTGGTVPAKIWRDYMRAVHKNKPVVDFTYPEIAKVEPQPLSKTTTAKKVETDTEEESIDEMSEETIQLNNTAKKDNYVNNSYNNVNTNEAVESPVPLPAPMPVSPPVPSASTSEESTNENGY